jgi:hypothetical protein
MFIITNDSTFINQTEELYKWMKEIGLVGPLYDVFDGVTAPLCDDASTTETLSYNAGMLAGALSYLYKATGKISYLNDAHSIFMRSQKKFTVNDIWTDTCEPYCKHRWSKAKGTAMMGFSYLYSISNNTKIRQAISQIMYSSAIAMANLTKGDGYCSDDWKYPEIATYSFHSQLNCMHLINSIMNIHLPYINLNIRHISPTVNDRIYSGNVHFYASDSFDQPVLSVFITILLGFHFLW